MYIFAEVSYPINSPEYFNSATKYATIWPHFTNLHIEDDKFIIFLISTF